MPGAERSLPGVSHQGFFGVGVGLRYASQLSRVSCVSAGSAQLLFSCVPSQPHSTGLPRPSGFALVSRRPSAASGLHSSTPPRSVPLALSGSSFPPVTPLSSVALAQPWSSGSPSPPRSPEQSAPPWPSVSSVSPWLSVCSAPPGSPSPAALSPLLIPRLLSANPPPCLLPHSTPPWGLVLAGLWISIWQLLLLASPWLLPPSTPHGLFLTFYFCPSPAPRKYKIQIQIHHIIIFKFIILNIIYNNVKNLFI